MDMKCTCEQGHHYAPVKVIEVSDNAIIKIPEILKDYHNIYMVCDQIIYEICGRKVEEILRTAGMLSHKYVLPKAAHATAENVGEVLIYAGTEEEEYDINKFSNKPDYILAVGSGSVNDICRMVSYRLGIEYGVCGTAPSMDGYVSVVAPLLVNNKKIVYTCTTARHVIIDLSIAANAPYELLLAGVGDMIGKYVAILDWELAAIKTGEYFCPQVAELVLEATKECVDAAERLKERRSEDIGKILGGLIQSGLGIAYTGSSRPASGTEHMIGQTWEVIDLENGRCPHLHGVDVGQATFVAMIMYMKLYEETKDHDVKGLIEKYIPFFSKVFEVQKELKLPFMVKDKKDFIDGIIRGRTFRVRYTLLQYLFDMGVLEEYSEYAYAMLFNSEIGAF